MPDLISHKVKLLAWMSVHIHIKRSRLREFLLVIPVHFLKDRRLAVDDFIV